VALTLRWLAVIAVFSAGYVVDGWLNSVLKPCWIPAITVTGIGVSDMADDSKLIALDQVKVGMFIKLDLSWFEHSFATSSFKITNQQQIQELLALNLKHIRYFPSKSDLAMMQVLSRQSGPAWKN
jgi:Domain of unknown function (DUF3391)